MYLYLYLPLLFFKNKQITKKIKYKHSCKTFKIMVKMHNKEFYTIPLMVQMTSKFFFDLYL
jgi:hypothetical protein